jgi:hypothetical protein
MGGIALLRGEALEFSDRFRSYFRVDKSLGGSLRD